MPLLLIKIYNCMNDTVDMGVFKFTATERNSDTGYNTDVLEPNIN